MRHSSAVPGIRLHERLRQAPGFPDLIGVGDDAQFASVLGDALADAMATTCDDIVVEG
ncbi:MAG: hypothetical protein K0V04_45665 [Deltaproteobacteria bacterium]|nr:hypothetical protein [Deltaproteobacteria bacterium]